jgi:hypothetical protein
MTVGRRVEAGAAGTTMTSWMDSAVLVTVTVAPEI